LTLLASWSVFAEGGASPGAPDAVITIRRHAMGADIVTVKLLNAEYPADLLYKQVSQVSPGSKASWGVEAFPSGSQMGGGFPTAQFVTDGLTDPTSGAVDLQALILPFVGTPAPYTLDTFLISIEDFRPVSGQTLMMHRTDTVYVEGAVRQSPAALDYTVAIASQNPAEIRIPTRFVPVDAATQKESAPAPPVLRYGFYALTLAAGASLVYFLLRRRTIV